VAKRLRWLLLGVVCMSGYAWGFDGDISIDAPNFKQENFLDIQANVPRPSERLQWLDTENGIQVGGASTDSHRLAYYEEVRLKHALSPNFNMHFLLQERSFYHIIPGPRPLFELAYKTPYAPLDLPIEVSVVGTPAYDKRQGDLGMAVSLGLRPQNYLRFQWIRQDLFYNEKNVFDDSRYQRYPILLQLEGDFRLDEQLRLHAQLHQSRPLQFSDPEQSLLFRHRSDDGSLALEYFFNQSSWVGMELGRSFVRKSLIDTTRNHGQRLQYDWLELYWDRTPSPGREWVVGARYDRFTNDLNDNDHVWLSEDYLYRVGQLYSTYYFSYVPNRALEYGLYVGEAREQRVRSALNYETRDQQNIESKLRVGWEYFATDQSSRWLVFLSLNLDDPINDPGDGGGMNYQLSF